MLRTSSTVRTANERQQMLDGRQAEKEERLARVAAAMKKSLADDDDDGARGSSCLCFRVARTRLRSEASAMELESAPSAVASAAKNGWWKRMFSRQTQQAVRLDQASRLLSERMQSLEERTKAARDEAKLRIQNGQKDAAMRALKRSKMLEASQQQAAAAAAALDRQRELFAEAALQTEVSGAIASTIKSMKGSCKPSAISSAERAMDDAQEVQDGLTDLNDVMAQFGASGLASVGADDDDALLEELNGMLEGESIAGSLAAIKQPSANTFEQATDIAMLPAAPGGAAKCEQSSRGEEESGATATQGAMGL